MLYIAATQDNFAEEYELLRFLSPIGRTTSWRSTNRYLVSDEEYKKAL
jgi:hypothetical protein